MPPSTHQIYTDGSLFQDTVGAAYLILDIHDNIIGHGKYKLPSHATIYDVELTVIYQAVTHAYLLPNTLSVTLYSDSLSALKVIANPHNTHPSLCHQTGTTRLAYITLNSPRPQTQPHEQLRKRPSRPISQHSSTLWHSPHTTTHEILHRETPQDTTIPRLEQRLANKLYCLPLIQMGSIHFHDTQIFPH